jgi:hypothetical protein
VAGQYREGGYEKLNEIAISSQLSAFGKDQGLLKAIKGGVGTAPHAGKNLAFPIG